MNLIAANNPRRTEKKMKTLAMYRPNTIQNALSDFDRYFESFFGDSILSPAARLFNQMPAVDIQETETAYILEMDLPGYDEKNIEVHVDGSSLTISCKQEDKEEKKNRGKTGNLHSQGTKAQFFQPLFQAA